VRITGVTNADRARDVSEPVDQPPWRGGYIQLFEIGVVVVTVLLLEELAIPSHLMRHAEAPLGDGIQVL